MRPADAEDAARVGAGALRGMQLSGYDYPIRRLRRAGGAACVTLPPQVRNFLELERGDWLVFGPTTWPGLAAFCKVSADRQEALTAYGRKEFRRSARRVQGRKGMMFVNISQATCEILSAEAGDLLIFGLTPVAGTVGVCAIKGGGESAGRSRMG